jgi:hypothetical protein
LQWANGLEFRLQADPISSQVRLKAELRTIVFLSPPLLLASSFLLLLYAEMSDVRKARRMAGQFMPPLLFGAMQANRFQPVGQ